MAADKNQLSALVVQLQQGDGHAFEEIYNLTRESAYFTALKIMKNNIDDAEDVLQESYVHMLEKIGSLDNPDVFQSWFNQIVANKAKDQLRKIHPERFTDAYFKDDDGEEVSKYDLMEDDDENIIPESALENTELQKAVIEMIDSLSDDKRTAVVLYYYDNMTTKQIAESLGVNENTVKSRLVQAKKDLAKSVTEYEKKHGKLLGVAPIPLVIWALKAAGAAAASSSVASGAAATTLAAVTAGTAVAGTAAAGTAAGVTAGAGVITKIIAGIVAAAIVGGGALAGTKAVQNNRKKKQAEQTTVTESVDTKQTSQDNDSDKDDDRIYIIPKEKKKVDSDIETRDFGFGVSGYVTTYTVKTDNGTETREYISLNRKNYSAGYNDLIPAAQSNRSKYSSQINSALAGVNGVRNGLDTLTLNEKLTEQAGVRAQEIALSGVKLNVRPDGTSYKTVFERNGYNTGKREEIIVVDCESDSEAVRRIIGGSNRELLSDPLINEIGIGVAVDPETNKYVYVVHLYSPLQADNEEDLSDQERALRFNSFINDIIDGRMEHDERYSEFFEQTPLLRRIGEIDIPIDGLFLFLQERINGLSDTVNDWLYAGEED